MKPIEIFWGFVIAVLSYGLRILRLTLGWLLVLFVFALSALTSTVIWIATIPYHAYRTYRGGFNGVLKSLPEAVRKRIPFYDSYGLRHNHDFLQRKETMALVAQMPLTEQATFCDAVTRDMVQKKDLYFRSIQFIDSIQRINPRDCNTTSIGNLAYVALTTDSVHVFYRCNCALVAIKEYFTDEKTEV